MPNAGEAAARQTAESVGSRSHSTIRYDPGRDPIHRWLTEEALFSPWNFTLAPKQQLHASPPAPGDATGGRAVSCSIGASAGIFACGQPCGVEKRKTAGKRGEGGGAAMLFSPAW